MTYYDAKELRILPDHTLWVRFADGLEGTYSIKHLLDGEVFQPHNDEAFFAQAFIDKHGVICWPNETDLAPDALYDRIKNQQKNQAAVAEEGPDYA
jgi:hypothetical protein